MALIVAGCATADGRGRAPAEARTNAAALALVARAQLRLQDGAISEGLELLRKAVEAAPGSAEVVEEYGLALAAVGLGEEATKQLGRVAGLSAEGEATLGMLLAQAAGSEAELEASVPHLQGGLDSTMLGPQVRLVLAQTLLRLGRGDEAWPVLQPSLADRPEDPRLMILAGQILRQTNHLDEAKEYFTRAAKVPEAKVNATVELVETLARAGSYREAADLMGELVQQQGATLTALTRWATLLARAGDLAKAREVLDDVLARDGAFREAVLLKALMVAGDGDLDTAEQLYRRALATDAEDVDAALGLSRVLIELRRLDDARAQLDELWARVAAAKAEAESVAIEVAQERAALELLDRAPAAAHPWLQRLLGQPLERRSVALWAGYFRQREAYEEGLQWLAAARIEPGAAPQRVASAARAEFSLALGDEEGGGKLLEALSAGDEDDVVAALGVLDSRKRHAQAVTVARNALARLGDVPDLRFSLAAQLERSGAWDEAVAEFRALIAAHGDDAAALNYLGYMFADRGTNLDEARELITRAVTLEPNSGAYLDSLGWVYFRLGDLALAEKHLTRAALVERHDATVHEHLGDLFGALGDGVKAAAAYRTALACGAEEVGQKERIEEKLGRLERDEKP